MGDPLISINNLFYSYGKNDLSLSVPSFQVNAGERVGIIGPSGCGKTTFYYLLSGIYTPAGGDIVIDNCRLSGYADSVRRDFRITRIGFIFQDFELLDYLSVLENICLPYLCNFKLRLTPAVKEYAKQLAASVGLGSKLTQFPGQLSQGEKQRVAICRALITKPLLLLADEPTGNLDPETSEVIMTLLLKKTEEGSATLLMITHDHSLLSKFSRVVEFSEMTG